jgi:septum formation protein
MDIDESIFNNEKPEGYVKRLALEKAMAGIKNSGGLPVLAADTSVVIDGHILGKPETEQAAIEMLEALSGRTHRVITGVALVKKQGDGVLEIHDSVSTLVQFLPLSHQQIQAYVATGEPMDKAGSYGIQGKAAIFVEKIEGSYSNVVGLPLEQIGIMLHRFNIPIWNA